MWEWAMEMKLNENKNEEEVLGDYIFLGIDAGPCFLFYFYNSREPL